MERSRSPSTSAASSHKGKSKRFGSLVSSSSSHDKQRQQQQQQHSANRDPEQEALRYVNGLYEEEVLTMIDPQYFQPESVFEPTRNVQFVIEHVLEKNHLQQQHKLQQQQLVDTQKKEVESKPQQADSAEEPPPFPAPASLTLNEERKTEEEEEGGKEEIMQKEEGAKVDGYTPLQELNDEFFWRQIYLHEKAVKIMNQRLSSTVMDNYNSFVSGMSKVQEIGLDLTSTAITCRHGRKRLASTKQNLVEGGLTVLAKYRKRKHLQSLVHHLSRIEELSRMEEELQTLLEESRFPDAIQLDMRRSELMQDMKKFDCVADMIRSKKDVRDIIEGKLDDALNFICGSFDADRYEMVLMAYRLLNDVHVTSKISRYYTSAIDELLRKIVMSYLLKNPKAQQKVEQFVKMKLGELAPYIPSEELLGCILQIFSVLADIMYNYNLILEWHSRKTNEVTQEKLSPDNQQVNASSEQTHDSQSDESSFDLEHIRGFVMRFRKTIWDLIVTKISTLLSACELSHDLSIDRFVQIFHSVNMFCELGEEFSQSGSYKLQGSLKSLSKQYFMGSHKKALDKFRLMMENDSWQQLEGFTMKDIRVSIAPSQEIKNHQSINKERAKRIRAYLHSDDRDSNPFKIAVQNGGFDMSSSMTGSPTEDSIGSPASPDEWSDEDEDDYEDDFEDEDGEPQSPESRLTLFDRIVSGANGSSEDEQKAKRTKSKSKRSKGPVFTNVSMSITNRIGTYLRAMEILQPINVDIFFSLSTLFKFYLYTVHSQFARTNGHGRESMYPESDPNVTERLHLTFEQTRRSLNKCVQVSAKSQVHTDSPDATTASPTHFFELAQFSRVIDITSAPLYGLVEKSTAAESLQSLLGVVTSICPKLRMLMPKPKVHYVDHFLKNMEEAIHDVRHCIYKRNVHMITNMESFPAHIEKCKWTGHAALSQNDYVSLFLKEFQELKEILDHVEERIPDGTSEQMWDVAMHDAMAVMTEGFARVKKCDNEGRAQMQLDLTNLVDGIQRITGIRPLPHTERVRGYVQAYYYPPDDIGNWIKDNCQSYTSKQIISLINVGPGTKMNKKQRVELLQKVEELEKNHKTLPEKALFQSRSSSSGDDTSANGRSGGGGGSHSGGSNGLSSSGGSGGANSASGSAASTPVPATESQNASSSSTFGSLAGKLQDLRKQPSFMTSMLSRGRKGPKTPSVRSPSTSQQQDQERNENN